MDRVRLAARRVEDLHVDLGAVEGAFAGGCLVRQAPPVEQVSQGPFGPVPHLGIAGVLAGAAAQREPVAVGGDPQRAVSLADHVEDGGHLGGHVGRRAEDVRVVELHGPHPGQAAQDAGGLLPELAAELGQAQRQLTVAALAGTVDHDVMGAQAGPQHQLVAALGHRREHVIAVVLPVAGNLIQLPLAQHRRADVLVTGAAFGLADEFLDRVPDGRAGRQPVRQPGAHQRVRAEQAELAAQLTMVGHHGLPCPQRGERPADDKAPGRSPRGCQHSRHYAGMVSGVVVTAAGFMSSG